MTCSAFRGKLQPVHINIGWHYDCTLAEVRDAAGHANVSITSAYLHVAVEDETVGNLFGAG